MKIPGSAKAKWIGLIPGLDFKIVAYHTDRAFYVETFAPHAVFRSAGDGAFNYHNTNRCVKEAFESAGYNLDYADQFDRTSPCEFVRNMLNAASFDNGVFEKNCYLFETL